MRSLSVLRDDRGWYSETIVKADFELLKVFADTRKTPLARGSCERGLSGRSPPFGAALRG
jgi:hypothetical protein